MAAYNSEFLTPVQLDQNPVGPFASAFQLASSTPPSNVMLNSTGAGGGNNLLRTAVNTSNSTSSSYTFLQIKREPSEVTTLNHQPNQPHLTAATHHQHSTSVSATSGSKTLTSASTLTTLVKIEPPSPKVSDLLDKSSAASTVQCGNTNNSVPIGIAVARKRPQETSTATLAACNPANIPLSQTFNKDLNCFGIRLADIGGTGCGNIFFTGNGDLMAAPAAATAEELALQSVNRTPSTIWQYPSAALPFESVISMSPATVGLQYSREASRAAGQVVLLPAATAAALGISNIPPLCYTPTDPFQQAAAAAALVWPSAYLQQSTTTAPPTAATLQSPHNFLFPTMNSAHTAAAAAAATLQPQSYAAAASLQLFGSSYLRNATEFMAAASKSTTTTQQSHLLTAAAAGTTPNALTIPTTPVGAATALSFETRDKTTMTTTTTTNLIDFQSNTQAALNLIRLPTPPTSATVGGPNVTSQLHSTPQILFQTAVSPAPTLLNLSSTGPKTATTTLPRNNTGAVASENSNNTTSDNFLSSSSPISPPTPVCDEPNTSKPLELNFKTTAATMDAANASAATVGVQRGLSAMQPLSVTGVLPCQPQMQDVNIQTDTPVCSEDENSTCPLATLQKQHQQQTRQIVLSSAVSGDAFLTPPSYNWIMNNGKMYIERENPTEPLELTKSKNDANNSSCINEVGEVQPQITKANAMCHNEKDVNQLSSDVADNNVGNRVVEKSDKEIFTDPSEKIHTYESPLEQKQQHHQINTSPTTIPNSASDTLCQPSSTADDFTGLELLSNISASSLPNQPISETMAHTANEANLTTPRAVLRVKQEPPDAIDDALQKDPLIVSTAAAKIEHNVSTAAHNGIYEQSLASPQQPNMLLSMSTTEPQMLDQSSTTEPLGGLNLLCALVEQRIQEEEEGQSNNFFASSSTNQHITSPTNFGNFHLSDQTSFRPMESVELSTTTGVDLLAAVSSPALPSLHLKRKKHKHSKSSKSSKSSTTSTSSPVANAANGVVSPSILCSGKIFKRSSKKNKKKYSKEKKRQQRAEAIAASTELDLEDEQLQEELQKAFISGTFNSSANRTNSSNVKWPSAQEIFNIMESRMRQRLADITRQYRKKKRKLSEISKTQKKRKRCSKLISQQLQRIQMEPQQNIISSPLTVPTLSLNTTSPLVDYKFSTKFTSTASTGPSSTATRLPYLQPSSFPLRFPPLSTSTADEDSDKNPCSRKNKKTIYKPVRLEPSSLSAALVANGATNSNSNNGIGNGNTNCNITINNNSTSTNANVISNYNLNTALRLVQKHASSEKSPIQLNSIERKLMSKNKEKIKQRTFVNEKGFDTKIKKAKLAKNIPASTALSISTEQQCPRSEIDQELILTNEHLYRQETRVLTDMGGLFYAGVMKPLQPPDIYAITLDGERGNKPHIMSREEICKDTILEVAPKSVNCVPVGTRLCAYWSQQYRCLYPGRAIESESSEGDDVTGEKNFVSVEFDDGDSGKIRLQNIRLLLSDYPIVEYNDNPLYSLGKQKKSGLKNGSHVGTIAAEVDSNCATKLFETTLGKPLGLPSSARDDDTEMYARRTERRHLKKNSKMKSQTNISPLGNDLNNVNATTIKPAANESAEQNRKHHKHKKHKKHKKHHRKGDNIAKNCLSMHTNSVVNDVAVVNLGKLQEQEVDQRQQQQEILNTQDNSLKLIKLESNNTLGTLRVKTEQIEDIEEESASNMMSENSDEVKGDDDEIEHNNSKGSKIAAFLPDRQLWGWLGTSYRKAGVKGRARKQFYKTIKRGKELITVGDCAVFLSTGRPDRPYIGRIESMWETLSSNKVVRVRWFYHPEETTGCPNLKYPGALFESPHEDENDVQTISHRCEVLAFECYFNKFGADAKQYQYIYDNNDTYYLAGYYNPRVRALTLQDNIPTTTATAAVTIDGKATDGAKVNKGGPKKKTNTDTSIP